MFSISRFLWILAACFSIYVQSATQSPNVLLIRGGEAVKSTPAAVPDAVPSDPLKKLGKRKRIKAKFKKWLGVFSQLDKNGQRVLTYYGMMFAGAIARSASATAVHPLNVIKTMLQTKNGKMPELTWKALSRGAGSQFIMSVPHGALNYAVTETTKTQLAKLSADYNLNSKVHKKLLDPILDFMSSAISTFICSIISTPQMVLTDRIMAGKYPNFFSAIYNIATTEGAVGFYRGWFPALVQKIPSYALTWMFFQQIKRVFVLIMTRPGNTLENTLLGSFSAAGACCVMIPVDTVKTRMVMQPKGVDMIYTSMTDCFRKVLSEEGWGAFYKALPPRLCAVMPMIGIQFSTYELMKRILLQEPPLRAGQHVPPQISSGSSTTMRMYETITTGSPLVAEKIIEAVVETIETEVVEADRSEPEAKVGISAGVHGPRSSS